MDVTCPFNNGSCKPSCGLFVLELSNCSLAIIAKGINEQNKQLIRLTELSYRNCENCYANQIDRLSQANEEVN